MTEYLSNNDYIKIIITKFKNIIYQCANIENKSNNTKKEENIIIIDSKKFNKIYLWFINICYIYIYVTVDI